MQISANFRLDDGVTGDEAKVVADLQELAVSKLSISIPHFERSCSHNYMHLGSRT